MDVYLILQTVIGLGIVAIFGWILQIERRISKLEAKIDLLCRSVNHILERRSP